MEIKKLSNKIFYTLVLILSISILTVVCIFNIKNYFEQKKSINNSLNISMTKKDRKVIPPIKKDAATHNTEDMQNRNIKFMDLVIYTILLDDIKTKRNEINLTTDYNEVSIETKDKFIFITFDEIKDVDKFIKDLNEAIIKRKKQRDSKKMESIKTGIDIAAALIIKGIQIYRDYKGNK